jgi:translation initiation factor 2 subunit 2
VLKYEELLERVMEKLPKKAISRERFQMPRGDIFYQGNTTVIKNFSAITDLINRDSQHFLSYLLNELGTSGIREGDRAVFQGKIPKDRIQERITNYIDLYVICHECRRPDTRLIREGRTLILKCDACGAIRPIVRRKRKAIK